MACPVKFFKFHQYSVVHFWPPILRPAASGSYYYSYRVEVYDKENIIKDLYNTLEKLRYPEVAQINYEQFEATILTGNERVKLLYWLLQENQNFNSTLLNKFKESSLEGKLLKCYSQMGFCNSEDILLGKCKIDEQLHFLSLLGLFIKRIYLAESESLTYDKETANSLIKADIVNVSPSRNGSVEDKSTSNSEIISHKDSKSLELPSSTIEKLKSDLENMCCNVKSILEESNKNQNDNDYEPKLQDFYASFTNITSYPFESCNSSKSSDDLNIHIEQIHTTFSTINKVLFNQVEFNNRPAEIQNNEKMAKPLSLLISNNVVLIEQACNMLKENYI